MKRIAFHARAKLDDCLIFYVVQQSLQDDTPQICVRHLASTEEDSGLYLVTVIQKAQHVVFLGLIIVLIDVNAELYLFDGDGFLVLLGGAFLLFFFVKEFPVILDLADWGVGVGRDLNQIETSFAGNLKGFKGRHDAELITFIVDHTHLAGADPIIHPDKTLVDSILLNIVRPCEALLE